MGTWGAGAFENDAAADWFSNLADESRPGAVIKKTVARIANAKPAKVLDIDDCLAAVAAAELVAMSRGHIRDSKSTFASQWVSDQAFFADNDFAKVAADAV